MSDDIDRLKTVLEALAQVNDTLKDNHEVMRDVVNAVKPVDKTDPEGHGALRDIARDINLAVTLFGAHSANLLALDWKLQVKARTA